MKNQVIEAFGVSKPEWDFRIILRDSLNLVPEDKAVARWLYVLMLKGTRNGEDFSTYIGSPLVDRNDAGQIASAEARVLTAMLTDAKES